MVKNGEPGVRAGGIRLGAERVSRCRDAGKKPFGLKTGPRLKRAPGPHFGEDQLNWLNQAAWNVERDSNPRQDDYKSSALPLSYPRLVQAPGVRSRTGVSRAPD